jgi:tyrosine-specific transport protein
LGNISFDALLATWKTGGSVVVPLTVTLQRPVLGLIANAFAFFAIITSFLGVSLGLVDFLRDGLKLQKKVHGRLIASFFAFVPPLFFVYAFPRGFMLALEYAGAFVAILLIFFPALMVWKLKEKGFYSTHWGRATLLGIMAVSAAIFMLNILDKIGVLRPWLGF